MKLLWRLILFVTIIAALNAATYLLLSSNLRAGLYNVHADSIGIPLAAGLDLSKYILMWLVPICTATSMDWPYRFSLVHPKARPWLIAAIALAYLWLAWLFFGWGVAFLRPYHYALAALCSAAALVPVAIGVSDIRRVRSNNSFKPKPLRGSA